MKFLKKKGRPWYPASVRTFSSEGAKREEEDQLNGSCEAKKGVTLARTHAHNEVERMRNGHWGSFRSFSHSRCSSLRMRNGNTALLHDPSGCGDAIEIYSLFFIGRSFSMATRALQIGRVNWVDLSSTIVDSGWRERKEKCWSARNSYAPSIFVVIFFLSEF